MLRHFLIGLGIAGAMVFAPPADAAGQQRPFPVIILECPSEGAHASTLCKALRDELETRAPHYLVRLGQAPDALGADHIALTLLFQSETQTSLKGQLRWRKGLSAHTQEGPRLSTVVMDANLTRDTLKPFAQSLLDASTDLLTSP